MTTNTQQQNAPNPPEFLIQRIYVKDLSFETPHSPQIFAKEFQPEISMDINIKTNNLDKDVYEIVLSITVTAKAQDKIAFLTEVQQAGIFTLKGFPQDQLKGLLGIFCPQMLYPYVREVITNLTTKGGFPPLYLQPINFEALYMQQQAAQGDVKH